MATRLQAQPLRCKGVLRSSDVALERCWHGHRLKAQRLLKVCDAQGHAVQERERLGLKPQRSVRGADEASELCAPGEVSWVAQSGMDFHRERCMDGIRDRDACEAAVDERAAHGMSLQCSVVDHPVEL